MEFQELSLNEFNTIFNTNIEIGDSFEQIGDKIDQEFVNIFYVSMSPDDVVEAIKNEQNMAERLGVILYKVGGGLFYIATY